MLDEFLGAQVARPATRCNVFVGFSFTGLPFGCPEPRLVSADRLECSQDHSVIGDIETHMIAFINVQGLAHRSGKCDLPLRSKNAACHDSYFLTFLHAIQSRAIPR